MERGPAGFERLLANDPHDVCVVGCGIAGTLLGAELVRAGLRTLIVESGRGLVGWLLDPRLQGLAEYEVSGDAGYPARRTKPRLLGGNSSFWAGRCERLLPSDFGASSYLPRDDPWPLRYADLEPYYERAEAALRVRGDEPSAFMPPRSAPLPLPASGSVAGLRRLLGPFGVTVDGVPTATPTRWDPYFRIHREILPAFLASPYATVTAGVTAIRLAADATRRVVGLEVKALDGTSRLVRARLFVVASGAIETARLLLLSRQDVFPRGIGNDHDRVGRGFGEHPSAEFHGAVEPPPGTSPPRHEVGRIYQFYETARAEALGAIRIAVVWSRFLLHQRLPPRRMLLEAARALRAGGATLYLGPHIEMRPADSNRISLSADRRDRFGDPLAHLHLSFSEEDRRTFAAARSIVLDIFRRLGTEEVREGGITFSRHHLGTCRMGVDPRRSVVDPDLRVHDAPNLYVVGSAPFVTGGAVPPTLTIAALTCRLADHLARVIREVPPA